ncbi:MAG: phytanoyl-CoA dioxygenase family protein [Myxococcales bacterium]|nr:phytanoyl-CoA dioxygenase family protein [Myxococcales bacterium]
MSYSAEMDTRGFTIAHDLFSADEVGKLREQARVILDKPAFKGDLDKHALYNRVRYDVFNRNPETRWLMTDDRVVRVMRALIGPDFVFLPEGALHESGYGGWHKDTTAQENANQKFQWEPDFLMVQVALYLQDNDPELAGGLDVIPGSHNSPDRRIRRPGRGVMDKVLGRLQSGATNLRDQLRGEPVRNRAGDLVMFHYRLDHRASIPRRPVPDDRRKLAYFFAISRPNRFASQYVRYIASRPDYQYLRDYRLDPSFASQLTEKGLTMIVPGGDDMTLV